MASTVDYSVYLVTDPVLLPPGRTLLEQVTSSIQGGATLVQLREKEASTRDFIKIAEEVHAVTSKHDVPLIINDRVDVALAIGAEGIHVGQDDMDVRTVRKLIGPDKILGLSIANLNEARGAIEAIDVLDYVGIGAVFNTATKDLKKQPMGPSGVREIMKVLHTEGGSNLKTVVIGGIGETNTASVMYTSGVPGKSIDGVAIVSAIMANPDAQGVTTRLRQLVKTAQFVNDKTATPRPSADLVQNVVSIGPMTHQITNNVVKNFSANVTLAIGASPIMSESSADYPALASVPHSSCLINAGTVSSPENLIVYSKAVMAYNSTSHPLVFDPVAAGASPFRRQLTRAVLNSGYFSAIKGNAAEILTLSGIDVDMKGVDSGEFDQSLLIDAAKKLALATRSIVVVTGKNDIIVEGNLTGEVLIPDNVEQKAVVVKGGHRLMGTITGSGCSLGSVIAAYLGANPNVPFSAVVTAVALYKHAGGVAGRSADSEGPGSFMAKFLDQLYKASINVQVNDWEVEIIDV